MTRANVGIEPRELCDQHLLAEWRELPRVRRHFSLTADYRAPLRFKLGKGHVLWLGARPRWVVARHRSIYYELIRRNFSPDPTLLLRISGIWDPHSFTIKPNELVEARILLIARIIERLGQGRPAKPRWTNTKPPDWAAAFAG